jgi:hypothetical protein
VIGAGFSVPPFDFRARAMNAIIAMVEDEAHHEARQLTEPVFAAHPITEHSKPRIMEILNGIRALNLPLNLFAGETGFKYAKPTDKKLDVWKLTNGRGYEIQFVIQEGIGKPHDGYGKIHGIWLKVDVQKQGAFWAVKSFVEQVTNLLLEHCGYDFLWGRAAWSANSRIKALPKPDKNNDWRSLPFFVGWDAELNPIVYEGLLVFYLRLGFFRHPDTDENVVVYPSRSQAAKLIAANGQDRWNELTQLSFARRREWHTLQRQRAALVTEPERKIREAMERQKRKDREHERQLENLWTQITNRRFDNSPFPF